ncbi:sensor histidine kinase [Anaerocolumna xylanovorans]|uniref:histidine kinase n=1 Tax=Anaerocolumna xylanovorans DSM 12503 TaxID=1121345 RepID=A0A1M7Y900_9FIRM|nr:HAMP domain-containing sensor histidine kinase [Anaerocolumna xylanovorans]SHO49112.1 Signal transduction histidine kinase [Anaerocolumna xylanovorans DSM 12503]
MKNKNKRIIKFIIFIEIIVYIAVTAILFFNSKQSVFSYLIPQISLILIFITIFASDRKSKVIFFKDILVLLDNMADNEISEERNTNENNYFSKIYHRIYKVYDILQANRETITEDKTNLQTYISDISHQIKTPVTNLKLLNTALMEYTITGEEQKKYLVIQNNQIEKIDFLIKSLTIASRLENKLINLSPQKASINQTIIAALEEIVIAAEKKEIEITFNNSNEYLITHDPKWTEEALVNILDNSVKYTLQKGSINILLEQTEAHIKISVSDTGIGIKEEDIPRIFKRFWRGNSTVTQGNGLGLYIAREIITLQGGYIVVDSTPDTKTCFSIYLPTKNYIDLST